MNGGPAVVFRTTDADTIAAYVASQDAVSEWTERVSAFAEKIGGKPWVSRWGGYFRLLGIDGVDPVPNGWRRERGRFYVVPMVSTKVGKAADAEMKPLRDSPQTVIRDMPEQCFVGLHLLSPGADLRDGALTVLWAQELPETEKVGEQWTRVPLSQWHAEREAREVTS